MKQKNRDKFSIIDKIEILDNRFGWIILGLYIIALAVVTYFHEPWFDEAQSWLIARDATLKDIIFYWPHYEGHPPLWHLYLIPFTRALPYEFGIKSASIILNTVAMGLLIFKAPFKKIIRYSIPFTYYFFYLYGVLSRCYSLTMLGFVLMAITYKDRNTKPFRFALAMMLVCASTAYGILLCGGVALVWLIEIIKEGKLKEFILRFIKDKRVFALVALFAFALVLVYLIIPRENTFAANLADYEASTLLRIFYMLILAPLEATFFTSIPNTYILMYCKIFAQTIVIGTILFLIFFSCLYIIGKRFKKLLLLIVPYVIFAVFAGFVYFTDHHISIVAYFLLFWFWSCYDSEEEFGLPQIILNKISADDIAQVKKISWVFPAIIIGFSLYWNISACVTEVKINYSSGHEVAEFIIENNMEDKLIMTKWHDEGDNINSQYSPTVLAYFDENIFYTLNNGKDDLTFNTHIVSTKEETEAAYEKWNEKGAPDILIGMPDLSVVFHNEVTLDDYTLVKIACENRITKDRRENLEWFEYIYVRNDLVDLYGFEKVNKTKWIEAFEAGEDME